MGEWCHKVIYGVHNFCLCCVHTSIFPILFVSSIQEEKRQNQTFKYWWGWLLAWNKVLMNYLANEKKDTVQYTNIVSLFQNVLEIIWSNCYCWLWTRKIPCMCRHCASMNNSICTECTLNDQNLTTGRGFAHHSDTWKEGYGIYPPIPKHLKFLR